MQDEELLRAYRVRGCQNSFAELVRRHVGLVYGTARRQVGNPHVAEEICEKVFCTLAQNVQSIRNPEQLPAWLYHTTRQLAAMHFRSEERRIRRERMAAVNTDAMDQTESWNKISSLLESVYNKKAKRFCLISRAGGSLLMSKR
jgi:DNA-directed RNA polymerase specialized sigma24 family protein